MKTDLPHSSFLFTEHSSAHYSEHSADYRAHLRSLTVAVAIVATAFFVTGCGGKKTDPVPGTTNTTGLVSDPEISPTGEPTDLPGVEPDAAVAPEPVKEIPLPTEPIEISTLKALLPQTIRGFKMQGEQSRTNVKYTVQTTMAKRIYEDESDRKRLLFYTITDTHKENVLRVNSAHFFNPEKLENTDTQREEIVYFEGMPCLEMQKAAGNADWSKFQVLVEDRVLVDIIGIGFPLEELRSLRSFIDIPLIREHVKEQVVQQQHRAYLEREQLKAQGLWPPTENNTARPAAVPSPTAPVSVAPPAPLPVPAAPAAAPAAPAAPLAVPAPAIAPRGIPAPAPTPAPYFPIEAAPAPAAAQPQPVPFQVQPNP